MPNFRIKIAEQDLLRLKDLVNADLPREACAFALAGVSYCDATTDILIRRPIEVPRELLTVQEEYHLEVSTEAINGLAALCEQNSLGAVVCHSHCIDVSYSPTDDFGERRVFQGIRPFLREDAPTASLLFRPNGIDARVWMPGATVPEAVADVIVVGSTLRRYGRSGGAAHLEPAAPTYDRQVRAFGIEGQAAIASSRVGVIGVGGTGSPTAEQLVRMGVRDLVLVDPDQVEESNLSRVFGTYAGASVGRAKVDVVAEHLRRIQPAAKVTTIRESVVSERAARALRDRDVLFLCTDEHWGRSIANQLCYQYLIPAINLGVQLARDGEGKMLGAGVVDVLRPDVPCLWCRQFLRAERIAAESMPAADRRSRARERYVEDIDTPAPSVVSLTTTLAGMGVTMFLQLTTGFMGAAGAIERLNYDVMDGTVRRGRSTILDRCVCRKERGRGDLAALPTLAPGPPD